MQRKNDELATIFHMVRLLYLCPRSKGQIVLGRIDWNIPATGRFVFDLRHRNLERALADAALRTREGTSGIQ